MATIRLQFKTDEVVKAIQQLTSRARPAIARALNRSADSGKTLMVRVIATDMGLKVGDVREFVKVEHATPERLTATFYASAKRVPLIDFKARGPEPSRGRGRGVTAKLPSGVGRYPNAFIATVGRGHRGVFVRQGPSTRKSSGAWSNNLPMTELHGPSIWQAFKNHQSECVARSEEQLAKNLPHEIEFALSRSA